MSDFHSFSRRIPANGSAWPPPAQIDKAVCSASAWLPISPCITLQFWLLAGEHRFRGNSTSGAGGGGVRSAQEAKNSTVSTAAGALVIFNGILIFLWYFSRLLAQLLLSPLLFGHHCAITGVIRAQCGD